MLHNIKILLVDDSEANRKVASRLLEKAGCSVDIVEDGQQALSKFRKNAYAIIFMDIQMPVMDGISAVKHLRAIESDFPQNFSEASSTGKTIIIGLTASESDEDQKAFRQAGADDVIIKPLTYTKIISKVGSFLCSPQKSILAKKEVTDSNEKKQGANFQSIGKAFDNDWKFITEVITVFLEATRNQMDKLIKAIAANNIQNILRETHSIKGGAATLFLHDLVAMTSELEASAKSKQFENATELYHRMKTEINSIENRLENTSTANKTATLQSKASYSVRILIVDDSETMCRIIKRYLNQEGFGNAFICKNGKEAIAALEKERFDIILSDWSMPQMNGLELLSYVRNHKAHKDIPFVMLTAETLSENMQEAFDAGVSDYICKPFTPKEISEKVKTLLSSGR